MGELADLVVVPSQPPLAGGRRDRLAALLELAAADDVDGLRGRSRREARRRRSWLMGSGCGMVGARRTRRARR